MCTNIYLILKISLEKFWADVQKVAGLNPIGGDFFVLLEISVVTEFRILTMPTVLSLRKTRIVPS